MSQMPVEPDDSFETDTGNNGTAQLWIKMISHQLYHAFSVIRSDLLL